jgi:uncharacterized cupredoxin-like copper-binding protein
MRAVQFVMALSLVSACASRESGENTERPHLIRLVASDLRFAAPDTIPAGLTRLRLVNTGQAWHEALITRLPDSATAETYAAGARAGDAFPVSAVDVGGPGQIAAGDSSEVVLNLPPGRYAIVCWSDNHVKAGMIVPLVVSATETIATGTAPAAEAEVKLEEYRFTHTTPFRNGRQIVQVKNTGQRPHNLQIYRLESGKTLADFGAWFASRQGAPPAVPVGGMSTMAPGTEAWMHLALEPGRYFIACGTLEGGKIHAQLGMIEEFEIR